MPGFTDRFSGLGLQYDNGALLVMSEYVTRRGTANSFDVDGYYVTGGYRFGPLMPYLTTARWTPKGTAFMTQVTGAARGVTAIQRPDGETRAIGVRWDLMNNLAVKGQFESTRNAQQFIRGTPQFNATFPKVKAYSLVADFVF